MILIGSHVSMSGKDMLYGSAKTTIENGANCLMIYTGAPQNTRRKPISELNIEAAHKLLKENEIDIANIIIHAPYIINLANTFKPETFEIGVEFLKEEISRTQEIGAKYIVLHPGSHVGAGEELGLDKIVEGLDLVLSKEQDAVVCLETMAGKGKGSELGNTFEQLAYIINNVVCSDKVGVCLDTCHIHDAGYDLNDFDQLLDEFDEIIGLDKLKVVHVNDSKNPQGSAKDRHDNFGYGHIGFDNLINVIYNERLEGICMILETPYVNDRKIAPYQTEIKMIKNKTFNNWLDEDRFIITKE